ncbi:MAG: LemA family protein [Polyangiaceae bacterium]|nr:LemA family protein [Polyangiaceae bacterium]
MTSRTSIRPFSGHPTWRLNASALTIARRTLVALLALVFIPLSLACQSYDVLVQKDQVAAEKWANVEASLQRRADLVPNLVATVKGSAAHEQATLSAVMQARAAATSIKLSDEDLSNPEKMKELAEMQGDLTRALGKLLAIQESYPDLKANQAFRDLMVQLEGTENRILRAREEYNAAARDYNAELGKVRGKVVNKVTGKPFLPRQYYQGAPGVETVPTVGF